MDHKRLSWSTRQLIELLRPSIVRTYDSSINEICILLSYNFLPIKGTVKVELNSRDLILELRLNLCYYTFFFS